MYTYSLVAILILMLFLSYVFPWDWPVDNITVEVVFPLCIPALGFFEHASSLI